VVRSSVGGARETCNPMGNVHAMSCHGAHRHAGECCDPRLPGKLPADAQEMLAESLGFGLVELALVFDITRE
jgi:hypothetical protein